MSAVARGVQLGGPAAPAALRLTVPRQRARVIWTRRVTINPGLAVRMQTSAPGLAELRIRGGGALITPVPACESTGQDT